MASAQGAKRKIGGHFGSAVGASTNAKKQRGGWRDEVDDEGNETAAPAGATAPTALAGEDSGSEEILDPGTPLPSESEEEKRAPAETAPAPSTVPAEESSKPLEEDGVTSTKTDNGNAVAQTETASVNGVESVASTGSAVTVKLELVIGETICATLQVLLRKGLDQELEARLAACAPPAGSVVEGVSGGALCVFGGHPQLTSRSGARAQKDNENGKVVDDTPREAEKLDAQEPSVSTSSSSGSGIQHSCSGFLTAPRKGPGLAITLGPQPHLDATHDVIGPLLIGRGALRRIGALAPLSGSLQPRQPLALRTASREKDSVINDSVKGIEDGKQEEAKSEDPNLTNDTKRAMLDHPFLLLEPAAGALDRPFSADVSETAPPAEVFDVVELELNGRDAEISEVKGMPFNRERAEVVEAIATALANIQERLNSFTELDEPLSHQRCWQQERASHLSRILQKLR